MIQWYVLTLWAVLIDRFESKKTEMIITSCQWLITTFPISMKFLRGLGTGSRFQSGGVRNGYHHHLGGWLPRSALQRPQISVPRPRSQEVWRDFLKLITTFNIDFIIQHHSTPSELSLRSLQKSPGSRVPSPPWTMPTTSRTWSTACRLWWRWQWSPRTRKPEAPPLDGSQGNVTYHNFWIWYIIS